MKIHRSEQGSTSIYFMIILVAIFLFNSILIDFARIRVAEKQSESIIRSAMRSVLSNFDSSLLSSYGLFALSDIEEGKEIFGKAIQLQSQEQSVNEFRLVQPIWDIDTTNLHQEYTLAHQIIFKQQVLEDMKYSAPIEFTLEVLDKFEKTGGADQLKEASSFSKLAEDLEELIVKRGRSLDKAWTETQKLLGPNGEVQQLVKKYDQRLNDINNLADEIGIYPLHKLYQQVTQSELERDELKNLKLMITRMIEYTSLVLETSMQMQIDYEDLIVIQNRIKEHINEAKKYNLQLKDKIQEMNSVEPIAKKSIDNTTKTVAEHIPILEDSYFIDYVIGIGKVVSLFIGFKLQFDPAELITGKDYIKRYQRLVSANQAYAQQAITYYSKQKVIEDHRKMNEKDINQLKSNQIEKIEELLQQVKMLFSSCEGSDDSYYERLEGSGGDDGGLYQKYIKFNHSESVIMKKINVDLDDPSNIGKRSMDLGDRIGTGLLNIRDNVYLNEYALTKFNYRTLNLNNKKTNKLSKPEEHKLMNQEAEYILYGLDSCVKNQSAAYAEMFAFRLAIRTMEALKNPQRTILNAGSPWLTFLWAVAEGSVKAFQDMKGLISGKEVVFSERNFERYNLELPRLFKVFYVDS